MFNPIYTFAVYFPFQWFCVVISLILIGYMLSRILTRKICSIQTKIEYITVTWYSLLLMYLLVLGRRSLEYYRYNFQIGWSYIAAFKNGDVQTLKEVVMNIIVFIPLGCICFNSERRFLVKRTLYGFSLSLLIELLQLVLKKGMFEFDDLISNTLGIFIGALIGVLVIKKILKRLFQDPDHQIL